MSDYYDIVTTSNVEVCALLLAVVRHWSDLTKGSSPAIVDVNSSVPLVSTSRILQMLKALKSALRWALEISHLSEHTLTSELLASVLYILNCSPKSMPHLSLFDLSFLLDLSNPF